MTRCILLTWASGFVLCAFCLPLPAQNGSIESLQPEFDKLIASDAAVERIATGPGFKWTEGPIWIRPDTLLFAEIPSNSIRQWTASAGVSIFLQPSGYQGAAPYNGPEPGSNGMTLDAHGRLTVAGHARRSVFRLDSRDLEQARQNRKLTVLADTYGGKRLNSPNDLVYKSDGSLYFTDPPYGFRTQSDHDPDKQLQVNGVYRLAGALHHPAGAPPDPAKLTLLIDNLPRPNGIAFSPDEKFLYVSNSEPKFWMKYPVNVDGSLGAGTRFFDSTGDRAPGSPDGLKLDIAGNVYSAGPGGVLVFSPAGVHLGTIHVPEIVSNLAFGDADSRTMYITASSSVYRVRTKVPGIHPQGGHATVNY